MARKLYSMVCPTCRQAHTAYRPLVECYGCSYKRNVLHLLPPL
jgi:hypothetical protein